MFLHLGGNTIVRTKDVIAILNAENHASAQGTAPPIRVALREGSAKNETDETKSIVITDRAVYFSPISSSTLKKRADYPSASGD